MEFGSKRGRWSDPIICYYLSRFVQELCDWKWICVQIDDLSDLSHSNNSMKWLRALLWPCRSPTMEVGNLEPWLTTFRKNCHNINWILKVCKCSKRGSWIFGTNFFHILAQFLIQQNWMKQVVTSLFYNSDLLNFIASKMSAILFSLKSRMVLPTLRLKACVRQTWYVIYLKKSLCILRMVKMITAEAVISTIEAKITN